KTSGTAGLGLRSSSEGLDVSPSVSFSAANDKNNAIDTKFGASLGTSFNSRAGLKALTLNATAKVITHGIDNPGGTGCTYSFANPTYIPSISMP
ncbi:hypothetical protein NUK32_21590, partial [Aeromonas caviae]|uniref:hypothetical protein n=1 Tax=Aeromonas caviae TaxID=648 RepID=UPI00214D24E9